MTYWIITIAIVAIALCVIAIVAVGMRGSLSDKAPDFATIMANTARHLNGDAEPPQGLVDFFEEIPDIRPKSADSASESPKR
ncbi:MAG TPA: hypothetical protein VGK17_01660 [Propionicimonas sp.]